MIYSQARLAAASWEETRTGLTDCAHGLLVKLNIHKYLGKGLETHAVPPVALPCGSPQKPILSQG